MTMTTSGSNLHGHTILKQLTHMPMTLSELRSWLAAEFGDHIEFHTCSQEGLSFEDIIGFFQAREKIVEIDGKWQTQTQNVCGH
jgi:probable metal-binding protein